MHITFRSALAAALAATATAGHAMVEHRVWYEDDFNYQYDYGDLSLGNSQALTPPSWACGRRYFDPSWYSWRGHHHDVLASGDFYTDIHVWLPLGGDCPHDAVVVERMDGSQTYAPASGTHYMAIHSHYGAYWIDADGGWPACNCALPGTYLKLATLDAPWGEVSVGFEQAGGQLAPDGLRVLDQTMRALSVLQGELARALTQRRRNGLGELEATVRTLEDHSATAVSTAARQGEECRRWIAGGAVDSAERACTGAARSVDAARAAIAIVASELHATPRD